MITNKIGAILLLLLFLDISYLKNLSLPAVSSGELTPNRLKLLFRYLPEVIGIISYILCFYDIFG